MLKYMRNTIWRVRILIVNLVKNCISYGILLRLYQQIKRPLKQWISKLQKCCSLQYINYYLSKKCVYPCMHTHLTLPLCGHGGVNRLMNYNFNIQRDLKRIWFCDYYRFSVSSIINSLSWLNYPNIFEN